MPKITSLSFPIRCCFTPKKKKLMSPLVSRSLVSMPPRSAVCHWVYIVSTLVNCYLDKGKVSVETLWSLGGVFHISIQSILEKFPPLTQSVFWKRNEKRCYKAPCWGGGLSPRLIIWPAAWFVQLLTDISSPNFPLFCSLPLHVLLIFIALAVVSVHIIVLALLPHL